MPMENLKFGAIPIRAEQMRHDPVSVERFPADHRDRSFHSDRRGNLQDTG
jgi:hypothetical protein